MLIIIKGNIMIVHKEEAYSSGIIFNGNIYLFHAFDIGDDVNLEKLEKSQILIRKPSTLPKYFKKYHKLPEWSKDYITEKETEKFTQNENISETPVTISSSSQEGKQNWLRCSQHQT